MCETDNFQVIPTIFVALYVTWNLYSDGLTLSRELFLTSIVKRFQVPRNSTTTIWPDQYIKNFAKSPDDDFIKQKPSFIHSLPTCRDLSFFVLSSRSAHESEQSNSFTASSIKILQPCTCSDVTRRARTGNLRSGPGLFI
mmetsp:Transcript_38878/g.122512  ORF Transcript_38878/g.122512 Transcript_38878/m.122512 type:complete len:140 (+) Transcript_38878:366-785(+)